MYPDQVRGAVRDILSLLRMPERKLLPTSNLLLVNNWHLTSNQHPANNQPLVSNQAPGLIRR